jgi:hypothetical protein
MELHMVGYGYILHMVIYHQISWRFNPKIVCVHVYILCIYIYSMGMLWYVNVMYNQIVQPPKI